MMQLDYSKIEFNCDGLPEQPELVLETMSESVIGTIPGVSNLKLNIKFSEPSEISFDVAAVIDGKTNWIYEYLTGYKIVYTKNYGVYVIMNPTVEADGTSDIKHISGFSIEYLLNVKKFFIEEGTFKFFDQTNHKNPDTLIGRILEIANGWSVGYISPALSPKYRTFDKYDSFLLPFMYGDAKEKFRCIFVFNPYEKTISAYDADEENSSLPIYLDFDNLLTEIEVKEISDKLVTALRPYGADQLDIRSVNPIGTNWIYDISYFISNGDIPNELAEKWKFWQKSILSNQMHYKALAALQASSTAQLFAAQAMLSDKQGEYETLQAQQSIAIQAIAMETTAEGKQTQQGVLSEINTRLSAKSSELTSVKLEIDNIQNSLNAYSSDINAIVEQLAMSNYFTDDECAILSKYFIEQDLTEDTFIASSIDTSASGSSYTLSDEIISVSNSKIEKVSLSEYNRQMYVLSGGLFNISGNRSIYGDIIRGTLDVDANNKFVLSIYAGNIHTDNSSAQSGIITVSGEHENFNDDISSVTIDEITNYEGTLLQFSSLSGTMYLTSNITDYQKYSVQMELFDFAVKTLKEMSSPTYEFSVSSGNFIFAQEFAPFRNQLELGKSIYLKIDDKKIIKPYIIEFELDFENRDSFSMVFSNRFKRYDNVDTLKDMVEKSYSYSRSFDASKHIYGQAVNQASAVSQFMQNSLDSAVNTIIAASNQSVIINGAGIHISSADSDDSYIQKFQLRIVNGMIAMSKDNWETADLAIGVFKTESGYHSGINAQVVAGNLVVGNNLVIENESDQGVMQFKVDSSGAWLNNSTFVLQKDNGGKIIIDPLYGILAGAGNLFATNGTTVTPSFIDNDGDIVFDSEGMPKNSNFFLDIRDGSAYFRGTVYAHDGTFAGELKAASGTFAGDISAASGTFKGTVQASRFLDSAGNNMMSSESGKWNSEYLNLKGLNINNNFIVDSNGKVTINNGTISLTSVTGIDEIDSKATNAQRRASNAEDIAEQIANGEYSGGTFISGKEIYSPTIYADEFIVKPKNRAAGDSVIGGYSMYGYYGTTLMNFLKIQYSKPEAYIPAVRFYNEQSIPCEWDFAQTIFRGHLDFSRASEINGLYLRFSD